MRYYIIIYDSKIFDVIYWLNYNTYVLHINIINLNFYLWCNLSFVKYLFYCQLRYNSYFLLLYPMSSSKIKNLTYSTSYSSYYLFYAIFSFKSCLRFLNNHYLFNLLFIRNNKIKNNIFNVRYIRKKTK